MLQPLTNAPSLVDMMNGIASSNKLKTQWQTIADLKTRAKIFSFLQRNNISDITHLSEKATQIQRRLYEIANEIKKYERRSDTLAQHLAQYVNYRKYKPLYEKYHKLPAKKGDAFYDKHFEEIQSFQTAKTYLDMVMNGKTIIPIKKWEAEQKNIFAIKYALFDEYYQCKDEIKNVEDLRRGAERIMSEVDREHYPTKVSGIEI
jgi:hypothetical protein